MNKILKYALLTAGGMVAALIALAASTIAGKRPPSHTRRA